MSSLIFFIKKLNHHRFALITSLLLNLLLGFSSVALLGLSGWFISASAYAGLLATAAATFNYFLPASIIRLLAFIRILSRYQDRVTSHDVTFKILATLRVWFYEKLIPLAPAHLLTTRSGDLLNQFVNDINTLDHLYLNVLSPLLTSSILAMAFSAFIFHFSPTLAITSFSLLLLTLLLLPLCVLKIGNHYGHAIQKTTALFRAHIVECKQTFLDLILFLKTQDQIAYLDDAENALISAQKKMLLLKASMIAALQILSGTALWLILFLGVPLVHHHLLDGAQWALIVFLIMATFEQCASLPIASLSLGKTQQAANRLLNTTHQKPAVIFPNTHSSLTPIDFSLSFNHVSFTYPHTHHAVLQDMQWVIPDRKHIGITGASGTGKTTLLHLIARIWDPDKGNILIGDKPLTAFSESELRKTVSLVTQQVHIFNATLRDNLTVMNNEISDAQLFSVLQKMELLDLIHALPEQLNTWMGEFGKNFSGGEIRRIAMARALLMQTPILLLDEPSTGLEETLLNRIWDRCANDFKHKTLVVVTHDKNLLSKMDHVFQI